MVVRANDSVRREVMYNPPIAFRITVKLVILIKMKSTVKSGKANTWLTHFLLRMVCNKAMIYRRCCQLCLSKCHEKGPQDGLKLTGTSQLLLYGDHVNLSCEKRNKALLVASRVVGLGINAEKNQTVCSWTRKQDAGQYGNLKDS